MTAEAILQITMMARDLTAGAVGDVAGGIGKIATAAADTAGKVGGAFSGMGRSMSVGLGSAVDSLVTGGGVGQAALTLAGFMAGEFTENFGGQLIEKLASSGIIATLTAPLAGIGSALGGIIAAAIPVGMALLPALLIAALVGAVVLLIANEGIRSRVIGFASGLVSTLINAVGGFLGKLPDVVGAAFGKAWSFVVDSVLPFIAQLVVLWFTLPVRIAGLGLELVKTVIGGMASLPGALARAFIDAIRSIHIDIGPFHLSANGFRVDMPQIPDLSGIIPRFASGVVGFGGGLAVVGERGPELVNLPRGSDVIPNSRLASSDAASVTVVGISRDELFDIIDNALYVQLRRAAPTSGRV